MRKQLILFRFDLIPNARATDVALTLFSYKLAGGYAVIDVVQSLCDAKGGGVYALGLLESLGMSMIFKTSSVYLIFRLSGLSFWIQSRLS